VVKQRIMFGASKAGGEATDLEWDRWDGKDFYSTTPRSFAVLTRDEKKPAQTKKTIGGFPALTTTVRQVED